MRPTTTIHIICEVAREECCQHFIMSVVIGGVIQTNDSINTSQVPFLGNVPILGNLFKRKTVSTSTQELIFFITPRIIQT